MTRIFRVFRAKPVRSVRDADLLYATWSGINRKSGIERCQVALRSRQDLSEPDERYGRYMFV